MVSFWETLCLTSPLAIENSLATTVEFVVDVFSMIEVVMLVRQVSPSGARVGTLT